jgi:predicted RNase H-like HicB family nuclease
MGGGADMSEKLKYAILIGYDEIDKVYLAKAVDLPGCMMHGDTYQEALQGILRVIPEWLEVARESGWNTRPDTIVKEMDK